MAVQHGNGCLWKFKVESNAKNNWPVIWDGDEPGEINIAHDANQANVHLAAQNFHAILDRQKSCCIASGGGGLVFSTTGVMKDPR